jgi:hypothetical protein
MYILTTSRVCIPRGKMEFKPGSYLLEMNIEVSLTYKVCNRSKSHLAETKKAIETKKATEAKKNSNTLCNKVSKKNNFESSRKRNLETSQRISQTEVASTSQPSTSV